MKSKVWRPLRWQKKNFTPGQGRLPSKVQLVSNLQRRTKALLWKGDGMIIFPWINAQNTLFQLPNVKNYIVWGLKGLMHTG